MRMGCSFFLVFFGHGYHSTWSVNVFVQNVYVPRLQMMSIVQCFLWLFFQSVVAFPKDHNPIDSADQSSSHFGKNRQEKAVRRMFPVQTIQDVWPFGITSNSHMGARHAHLRPGRETSQTDA